MVQTEITGMRSFSEPENVTPGQLVLDYLLFGLMFMSFVYYYKRKFSFYRQRVETTHRKLNQSLNDLYEQNRELARQEEEIRAIKDNLEELVAERGQQIELKNKELAEYAFINAHLLRAPLCRILGLLNLMETEPQTYPAGEIERVRTIANDIDRSIREINQVVSQ
jgi:signal transduction histidine kinase